MSQAASLPPAGAFGTRAEALLPRRPACWALEHVVGPVAVGPVIAPLAAAEVDRAAGGGDEAERLVARRLVGAVAEGLLLRAPTATPQVGFAFYKLHLVGPLLGADRLVGHPHLKQP